MRKNSGTTDRIIRLLISVTVFVLILTGALQGLAAVLLGILAGILLLTGSLGLCPFYELFGLHTLRTKISHDS